MMLLVTVGSVALGLALSRVMLWVSSHIQYVATAVVVQFCGTAAVWLLAERLQLSGILTMVVFAIATARRAADVIPARIRVPSYAVWEVAVFVLNVLAFILVGFQLKSIVARLDRATFLDYAYLAAAVCVATVVARILWVTVAAAVSRWWCTPARTEGVALSRREAAVVGWCGMRGTVTLAAALALPSAFPYRDLILFTAFAVVLGTLVVQGMTLRPVMLRLQLRDDGSVEREARFARVESLRAALAAVGSSDAEEAAFLRSRYELLLRRAEADPVRRNAEDGAVVRAATAAERQRLVALRQDGTIGDAAFQRVEQELDLEELDVQQLLPPDARE